MGAVELDVIALIYSLAHCSNEKNDTLLTYKNALMVAFLKNFS